MARILLPTRNRPTSLLAVFEYLDEFHPDSHVIVADGSSDDHAGRNAEISANSARRITVDYVRYPYDMPFFDRLLDMLVNIDDEFIIMGSDDDYPLLDALDRGEQKLRQDETAVSAFGATLKLSLRSSDDLTIGMTATRPLLNADPATRARSFASRSFSTTYAVTRRTHLIERYGRARKIFMPGFFDFGVGIHDALAGRVHVLPEFTFIASHNHNHSYLRLGNSMAFMNRLSEFNRLKEIVVNDIKLKCDLEETEAVRIADRLFSKRIVELFGGIPVQGGHPVSLRDNKIAAQQVGSYFDLFTPKTKTRANILPRLRCVVEAVRAVSISDDNEGEASTVDSLEGQQKIQKQNGSGSNRMFTGRAKSHAECRTNTFFVPNNVRIEISSLKFAKDQECQDRNFLINNKIKKKKKKRKKLKLFTRFFAQKQAG